MKFKFGLTLIFILIFTCYHTGFSNENANEYKGLHYSLFAKRSKDSLTLLKKKIGDFAKKKDYQNAILHSKKLLAQAQQLPDSSNITNAYWRQGFYFKRLDQLDSAYFYYDKSYTLNL